MVFRSSNKGNESIVPFRIENSCIEFVESFKYLGYVITKNLSCNDDILRARNKFYAQFNMIMRIFNFADMKVKLY